MLSVFCRNMVVTQCELLKRPDIYGELPNTRVVPSDYLIKYRVQSVGHALIFQFLVKLVTSYRCFIGSLSVFVYCQTPRKYVFDVTSIDQHSSSWTCKLSESRDKISPRVQAPFFRCTTYVATNAFNERIGKYRGSVFSFLAKF